MISPLLAGDGAQKGTLLSVRAVSVCRDVVRREINDLRHTRTMGNVYRIRVPLCQGAEVVLWLTMLFTHVEWRSDDEKNWIWARLDA